MNKQFLKKLKALTKLSDHDHKLSCLVTKKDRIISSGYNQKKTCPNSPYKYKYIHCEYNALKRLNIEDTKGCTVYIYRENKQGIPSNAAPCIFCRKLLQSFSIKRIIYSYDNSWIEETF